MQFSEHMKRLGGDRRQARDRAVDPPRPGEPRRGQPLHDDRAPRPGFRSAAARSSASTRASARSPPTSAGHAAACRRTSRSRACRARAGRTSWGRSTPRSSCPTTRTRRASASATSPRRAASTTTRVDRPPRPPRPGRPLPAVRRQGGRRPGRGARRVLRAGLRPDGLAPRPSRRFDIAPRRPAEVRDALRPQPVRPALPARPPAGRGRRAVRHPQ